MQLERALPWLMLSFACACTPPLPSAEGSGTSESESSTSSSTQTSESSATGETEETAETGETSTETSGTEPPAEPEPPECSAPHGLSPISVAVNGDWLYLHDESSAQSCTVMSVEGSIGGPDDARVVFECPEAEQTVQELRIVLNSDEDPQELPLAQGREVELRTWISIDVQAVELRDADSSAPLVIAINSKQNELMLTDFADEGGPDEAFLAPYTVERIDLGCTPDCAPGNAQDCAHCDTRMGLLVGVDRASPELVFDGTIVDVPANNPIVRAYANSYTFESESFGCLEDGWTQLLLVPLP